MSETVEPALSLQEKIGRLKWKQLDYLFDELGDATRDAFIARDGERVQASERAYEAKRAIEAWIAALLPPTPTETP